MLEALYSSLIFNSSKGVGWMDVLMIIFATKSDGNFNTICGAVLNFLYLALPYNITL